MITTNGILYFSESLYLCGVCKAEMPSHIIRSQLCDTCSVLISSEFSKSTLNLTCNLTVSRPRLFQNTLFLLWLLYRYQIMLLGADDVIVK